MREPTVRPTAAAFEPSLLRNRVKRKRLVNQGSLWGVGSTRLKSKPQLRAYLVRASRITNMLHHPKGNNPTFTQWGLGPFCAHCLPALHSGSGCRREASTPQVDLGL